MSLWSRSLILRVTTLLTLVVAFGGPVGLGRGLALLAGASPGRDLPGNQPPSGMAPGRAPGSLKAKLSGGLTWLAFEGPLAEY